MTAPVAGIVVGVILGALFLLTCVISAVKAVRDRKRIKARIAARERAAREGVPYVDPFPDKPKRPKRNKDKPNGTTSQVLQVPEISRMDISSDVSRPSAPRSVTYEMASQEPSAVVIRNGSLPDAVFIPRGRGVTYISPARTTSPQRLGEVNLTFLEDHMPRAPLADTEETTSETLFTVSTSHQQMKSQPRLQHWQKPVTRADLHRRDLQFERKTRSAKWSSAESEQPIEVLINPRRFSYAAAIDAQYQLELEKRNHNGNFVSTDDILQEYQSSPGQRRAGRENKGFEEMDL